MDGVFQVNLLSGLATTTVMQANEILMESSAKLNNNKPMCTLDMDDIDNKTFDRLVSVLKDIEDILFLQIEDIYQVGRGLRNVLVDRDRLAGLFLQCSIWKVFVERFKEAFNCKHLRDIYETSVTLRKYDDEIVLCIYANAPLADLGLQAEGDIHGIEIILR